MAGNNELEETDIKNIITLLSKILLLWGHNQYQ